MKHLIMVISMLFLGTIIFGQKVKIIKNEISVNKKLYCYLEKGGSMATHRTYSIQNLDKEELMFLKSYTILIKEGVYEVYFIVTISGTEETFEVARTFDFKKDFIKGLYKHNVIKNNKINEEGLKLFKREFAGEFKKEYTEKAEQVARTQPDVIIIEQTNKSSSITKDYIIVERDKTAHLFISRGKVKQDFKQIATFKVNEEEINEEYLDVIYIYNINNQLIAKGYTDNFEKSVKIITLKDNKRHFATSKSSLDSQKVETTMELLIKYLYI